MENKSDLQNCLNLFYYITAEIKGKYISFQKIRFNLFFFFNITLYKIFYNCNKDFAI